MAKNDVIPLEELRQLLVYDAANGRLFWKPRPLEWFMGYTRQRPEREFIRWNKRHANREAGSIVNCGYRSVMIRKVPIRAHRIIWCMHYGSWPQHFIDHIDGDRLNNHISNLRDVDNGTNCRNQRRRYDNKTGATGVSKTAWGSWLARVNTGGREHYAGTFHDFDEAVEAVKKLREKFGFGPTHGSV